VNAGVSPSITDYAEGIHDDIPESVYHQRVLGLVNNGSLKILLDKTPAHYLSWITNEGDASESTALHFGRAMHCAIIEPDVFDRTYVKPVDHPYRRPTASQLNAKKPSDQTLKAIDYWSKWKADNIDLIEITAKEKDKLLRMAESLAKHTLASRLLTAPDAMGESTALWTDPKHKLLCKARIDLRIPSMRIWCDLKSTEDASPQHFPRSIAKYGYHIQHAHYSSASEVLDESLRAFLFIAVEKEPPYAVAVHAIDAEAESRGIELRDRAMETLTECLINDNFPAYAPTIHRASLPTWALRD
jgi:hypothetical protein